MGDMWLYPPEPIEGSHSRSVKHRLGELPPYPCLQSTLRLERSSFPARRNSLAVSKHLESDVDYIFWDAYDKMAPVEHRKKIGHDHLCQRDVTAHAFGTQHRGNDRFGGTHRLGGHSDPINVQYPALALPSMELFENFVPGPCNSDHYCLIEPSKDRQAEADAEPCVELDMLLQPERMPVSHEALVSEDKTIYAGLEPVEARCVDIGNPEYDATTKKFFSETLDVKDSRSLLLNGLQEKPHYDRHALLVDTQYLANGSISKPISGSQKTSPACEPSIASNFGHLGVVLAFTIIQFLGQDGRPTNTEKETRNAVKIRTRTNLRNDPWQFSVATLNQLLHEHHDISLAFDHGAECLALKKIAAQFSERLSAFERSWTECLEAFGRYRKAIDEDEPSSRKIDRVEARTLVNSETDRRCPAKSQKPRTSRIRERRLHAARLENTDQHPLLPAAVKSKDLEYGKDDISTNIRPLSPVPRNLKDLERSKQCISVHTKDLGLSPKSFSAFMAYPPNAYSTTLPAPVTCTQLKTALFTRRSMGLYRYIQPCHVLMALGFITIIGSLAPAIWRSTKQNDISGGFSLGQYILGAGIFVIGSVVVIHSKTCTCWE